MDIVIPDVCPVLGVKLEKGRESGTDNSPSLDRIVPALGYVPGNIRIISNRANRIKNDSTPEELALILAYVLKNTPKPRPRRAKRNAKANLGGAPMGAPANHQP